MTETDKKLAELSRKDCKTLKLVSESKKRRLRDCGR